MEGKGKLAARRCTGRHAQVELYGIEPYVCCGCWSKAQTAFHTSQDNTARWLLHRCFTRQKPSHRSTTCVCCGVLALTVVVSWVLQVLQQALDGSQTLHGRLGGKAQEGNHGQAGVLDLLDLGLGGLHAHGVKGSKEKEAGLQREQEDSEGVVGQSCERMWCASWEH